MKYAHPQALKDSKFSKTTLNLMQKRQHYKVNSAKDKVEEAELNKLIKKQQNQDIRLHNMKTIEEIVKKGKGFKRVHQKLNHGKLQITRMKEENRTVTTDQSRILERSKNITKIYTTVILTNLCLSQVKQISYRYFP